MTVVPKPKHRRRVPKQADRNEFDSLTRKRIKKRDNGQCQICHAPGNTIHHVMPRGAATKGRGVFENGLLLCGTCHIQIHNDKKLLEHWQKVYEKRYGPNYYLDEWDRERELSKWT